MKPASKRARAPHQAQSFGKPQKPFAQRGVAFQHKGTAGGSGLLALCQLPGVRGPVALKAGEKRRRQRRQNKRQGRQGNAQQKCAACGLAQRRKDNDAHQQGKKFQPKQAQARRQKHGQKAAALLRVMPAALGKVVQAPGLHAVSGKVRQGICAGKVRQQQQGRDGQHKLCAFFGGAGAGLLRGGQKGQNQPGNQRYIHGPKQHPAHPQAEKRRPAQAKAACGHKAHQQAG